MGNVSVGYRRHHRQPPPPPHPPPQPPQPEITGNHQYVYAAATPYRSPYPNPNLQQYRQQHPGYYPLPSVRGPYGYHHHPAGHYSRGAAPLPITPYVEHQKAVTIRNDVNIKKETLRVEPDEENPGKFLVAFSFDATAPGRIAIMFFAKEGVGCNLIETKGELFKPVTISFQQGLGQKFRQPPGSGVDFSTFEETDLMKEGDTDIYPLIVKAEAYPLNDTSGDSQSEGRSEANTSGNSQSEGRSEANTSGNSQSEGRSEANSSGNSQFTLAVFEKEKGEYQVRVVKQILWVDRMRYELQEIYGIGNAVDGDLDTNDPGKECVICLSEPRDTTVLPCRHMCMCSGCAKVLRFQTNRCPICRQPVERLLEIKVNNVPDD